MVVLILEHGSEALHDADLPDPAGAVDPDQLGVGDLGAQTGRRSPVDVVAPDLLHRLG